MTGTYRTDFGPIVAPRRDRGSECGAGSTATYGLRSVCRSTGCVATASRLSGPPVAMPTMVFDQIGGHWVAVALGSDQCRDASAEFWQVFTLQPRPDGTLVGEYTATAAKGCADKRTVTLTRTGGVDDDRVADPARQPARVVSPAEALHGSYRTARTFSNGAPATAVDRRGHHRLFAHRRSMHELLCANHAGYVPLVFGAGNWNWQIEDDGQCPQSGATTHVKNIGTYPLPQPPQNPITLLTGHGHHDQSAPCALSLDFDETFTRTGD